MRICIIDPITGPLYPGAVEEYAAQVLGDGATVEVHGIDDGPASVEGHVDVALAAAGVVRKVRELRGPYDAFVVNCFLDPGLDAVRELTGRPVAGAGEASMLLASQCGYGIGAVSLSPNSQSTIHALARRAGLLERLFYAGRIDVPVLDLEAEDRDTLALLERAAQEARAAAAEVLVLGCTGLFRIARELRRRQPIPIIEPLAAALALAQAQARAGFPTSRLGYYAGRPQ